MRVRERNKVVVGAGGCSALRPEDVFDRPRTDRLKVAIDIKRAPSCGSSVAEPDFLARWFGDHQIEISGPLPLKPK